MDAASIRLDHNFNDRISIFGRFNWAPSENRSRVFSLSDVHRVEVDAKTVSVALSSQLTTNAASALRFNYFSKKAGAIYGLDVLGGAPPPSETALIPSPNNAEDSTATFVGLFGI